MRALLWLIGIFALAVGLVILARYNDAYALFVWAPWRLHISLNLLAILTVLAFLVGYFGLRIVIRALELPAAVAAFRERQKRIHARQSLRDAQRYLIEGRYGRAFSQARAAWEAEVSPGLSALIAARASHALREFARCEEWLEKAAARDPEVRVARLMSEAEFAIADRRFELAAQRLESLRAGGHRHIAAQRLSLQVASGLGQWSEVLRLARLLAKHHALTADQAAPLLRRAHIESLREAEGAGIAKLWRQIPRDEREDPLLVLDAARLLGEAGESALAAEALQHALDANWDPSLAELYGRIEGGEVVERIAVAEAWLSRHRDDAKLLLALGRLCLQKQLWGKAQSYIEASLSVESDRHAHLELARLAERLGKTELAMRHFRLAAEIGV